MTGETDRSPLLTEEDWWTVWFGLAILLIATVLAMLTLSGTISAKKVPKIGKWSSNPSDAFYAAKKTSIDLDAGTTLSGLAEAVNSAEAGATATLVSESDGTRLRIATARGGDRQTISLSALLSGGSAELRFDPVEPDSDGLGAVAYISQPLSSADVDVGAGKLTITGQRSRVIAVPLAV
ncbi:MAG: flagellin hook IN motif-containing protein, partial [Holophagae bacterium]